MAHWKLTLSYDGTEFCGWQVQPGLRTIQGVLAAAIEEVVGERVLPQGSGRTDAGVHALGQVASFMLGANIPAANLERALNRALPPSVRVLMAEIVDDRFHARHSAVSKRYEYRLFAGGVPAPGERRTCSPFLAPFVWDCKWAPDLERMNTAAKALLGEHDFASFAASDPDRTTRLNDRAATPSTVRTISACEWFREDGLLIFRVHGNGFLHHMVRNLVGTLVEVGRSALPVEDMPRILAARDRRQAGPTAPARGLFLVSVDYPAAEDISTENVPAEQHPKGPTS